MQPLRSSRSIMPSRDNRNLLYSGLAALILIVIVTGIVTLTQLRQQAELRTAATTLNLARSIEQTMSGLIDTIDMALLASSNEISQHIANGKIEGESIDRFLSELKKLVPAVIDFRVTNERGDVIYGLGAQSAPVNISDRAYFIRHRDDPAAGLVRDKPFMGRISQVWVWIFARRINRADGSFGGVVFAAVSIEEITRMLAKVQPGSDGSIALRDEDLGLIARHAPSAKIDVPIGEKRFSAPFKEALKLDLRNGTYGSGATSIDGVDRTYSYQRSAKYGFLANVGITNDAALAEWRTQAWIVGGLLGAFGLASAVFAWLISKAWRRQEEAMASLEEAQQIGNLGHYSYDMRTDHWISSPVLDGIFGIGGEYPRDARHWWDLTAADFRKKVRAYLNTCIADRLPFDREYRIVRHCDGEERWVHGKGIMQFSGDGAVVSMVGTIQDITARKQVEADLRVAAVAFESQQGMVITDARSVILRVNRAFTESTGYTAEEVIGQTPKLLKSSRHDAEFFRLMWDSIERTGGWQGEIWDRCKDGHEYPKWLTISAVKDDDGAVTHYIGTHFDISERKLAEERINELAFFDQLTGLPNRTLLLDRLKQTMTASARSGSYGALLLIDLDNFKTLNDTLGHDMGDLLLKQVAARLTACVRAGDTVARLGGDEFVVMLTNLSLDQQEAATRTELVGEKIRLALNQTYQLNEVAYYSTPSIGASLFSDHGTEIDALLKQADLAMYRSKETGRNALRFFDPDMEVAVMKRAALESDLHEAVATGQFILHYQPQMAGGQLTGAEVLVRWLHPQRGLVPPADFIPLAEETGLIVALGQWVLQTACVQLAAWAKRPEMAHLTIAVNVSAHQFRHADFVAQVMTVLKNTGANPQRLKLELTESLLVSDVEEVIEKMFVLRGKGVGFSLDDFGTGYSSLAYLKRLPLDQLKIDRSFVRDVLSDANDASIAKTIIALAQSLGLGVIAEGVETAMQRDFLASSGCHAYQGYFFSRPLPIADFEVFAQRS